MIYKRYFHLTTSKINDNFKNNFKKPAGHSNILQVLFISIAVF